MKFASTIAAVLLTIPFMTGAAACSPACCDIIVNSVEPAGTSGISCTPGGIDCGFVGQITACCQSVNPLTRIGIKCTAV
ncbi:uncharacterized protein LACBIDRAFT_316802 [Laccaria bicolor S238N-H82]|uniref:Predicted protein n=1 Tax=Laccaria bicolor (strain S238N-H82 / ATCC MYA-4686) TaxID=486041 RepID=B0E1N2_LACBS|nr:uncharacterized protein LACBIDRAFT_316802 [Laccaria bicolor S238N-H82]EDQ99270.1 predicted protein [Laccaria bicolor S238N-H82]|eukprot:XP_001890080.1 predicted protein [Laccaria bicolor S238N-H82]